MKKMNAEFNLIFKSIYLGAKEVAQWLRMLTPLRTLNPFLVPT